MTSLGVLRPVFALRPSRQPTGDRGQPGGSLAEPSESAARAAPRGRLDVHPRVAMQILRHSKIAITMEIYTEVASCSWADRRPLSIG